MSAPGRVWRRRGAARRPAPPGPTGQTGRPAASPAAGASGQRFIYFESLKGTILEWHATGAGVRPSAAKCLTILWVSLIFEKKY